MKIPLAESRVPTRVRVLAAALLARGVVNGAFALWLVARPSEWDDVFRVGSTYAVLDGGFGLLAAILIDAYATTDSARFLGGITFADSIARVTVGILLRVLPGVSGFPVATVSLFGAIGVGAATLGIGALGLWLITRARAGHGWSKHPDALWDPIAVAALVSFVGGYVLFLNPPITASALRGIASGASGALSLIFLIAFAGAITHRLSAR